MGFLVDCLVHFTELSLADDVVEEVILDFFAHLSVSLISILYHNRSLNTFLIVIIQCANANSLTSTINYRHLHRKISIIYLSKRIRTNRVITRQFGDRLLQNRNIKVSKIMGRSTLKYSIN